MIKADWIDTLMRTKGVEMKSILLGADGFALQLVQYVVMPDELTYQKQALEFAHGTVPTPSDFWFNSWALLRPLTMAPFFRWLSVTHAFDAVHVTGALIMASAASTVPLAL